MKIIAFGAALLLAGCTRQTHATYDPQVDCTKAMQYAIDVAATRQVTYGWVGYAGCWFRVKRNERLVLAPEDLQPSRGTVTWREHVSFDGAGMSKTMINLAGKR